MKLQLNLLKLLSSLIFIIIIIVFSFLYPLMFNDDGINKTLENINVTLMMSSSVLWLYALYKIIFFYIELYKKDKNNMIKHLNSIKNTTLLLSLIYVSLLPYLYLVAEIDDAPGVIIFGFIPIIVSLTFLTIANVIKKVIK